LGIFTKEEKTGNYTLNQITQTQSIQLIIKKKTNYPEIAPLSFIRKLQLLDRNIETKLTLFTKHRLIKTEFTKYILTTDKINLLTKS